MGSELELEGVLPLLGLLTILVKVGKIFKTNFSDVFGG
jgi:hypothetical protein